jgi:hypothetical protein
MAAMMIGDDLKDGQTICHPTCGMLLSPQLAN